MILKSDEEGEPDVVELGDLRMFVIVRDGRQAVRLRNLNAQAYKKYQGLRYFPLSKEYRIEADLSSAIQRRKSSLSVP